MFSLHRTTLFLIATLIVLFITAASSTVVRSSGPDPAQAVQLAVVQAPTEDAEGVVTGSTGLDMSYNGSHLFVAIRGNSSETCSIQDPPPSNPVLQRVDPDGSNPLVLLERCGFHVDRILADADHVYFIDDDNDLSRISVNGGPLEHVVGTVGGRGLAMDDDYVYWAQVSGASFNNTIIRQPKAGGLMDIIISVANDNSGYQIRDMVVDDDHIYWVEGAVGNEAIDEPGTGAVRRVAKDGTGLTTLADESDGVDNPISLAIDDPNLFWTQWSDNRIRRVAMVGGSVQELNPSQELYVGQFVAAGNGQVFWSETDLTANGRIRRVDADGSNDTILAVAVPDGTITGPQRIMLTDTHVYWAQSGGVYRLPLGASSQSVDLTISDIELVQAVQNLDGNVPLVAGKTTTARVYPELDITYSVYTDAVLRGYRNGELLGELEPLNPTVRVLSLGWNREDLEDTFNFALPPHWTEGSLTLEAEINTGDLVPENEQTNNTYEESFVFQEKRPICLMLFPIDLDGPDTAFSGSGIGATLTLARTLLPTPDLIPDTRAKISEAGGAYELPDDKVKVLLKLAGHLFNDALHKNAELMDCFDANRRVHYVGVADQWSDTGSLLGSAYGELHLPPVLWFRKMHAAAPLTPIQSGVIFETDFVPYTYPWSGSVLAHEMSHNMMRDHITCGNPDEVDGNYPYNPCRMDDVVDANDASSHWGFDYRQINNDREEWALIDPAFTADYMTYSDPAWVSDYTFQAIFDWVSPLAAASADGSKLDPEILYVSGVTTPTTGIGALEDVYRVSRHELGEAATNMVLGWGQGLVNPEGSWSFEQTDANGDILSAIRFEPHASEDYAAPEEESVQAGFVLPVRLADGAAGLRLRYNDGIVDERKISRGAPKVKVISPASGEDLAESIPVEWVANDADGDPLRFDIFYSGDDGQSWDLVAMGLEGSSYVISDTMTLAGSSGESRIRVQVSDGVNLAWDDTDRPFSLRPHKPRPYIETPADGDIFGIGDGILLTGSAWDAEDGNLGDQFLTWSLDGVPVGSGRHFVLPGPTPGAHQLGLKATDYDGWSDEMVITIYVQARSCSTGTNQLDLVFVVDGSNSMQNQHGAICKMVPEMVEGLEAMGLDVRMDLFEVMGQRGGLNCATGNLATLDVNGEIDHPSDWGGAVSVLSHNYDWREDAARIIVPVSNQGPENGDPIEDPGADRETIGRAIVAANGAGVAVSPLWIGANRGGTTAPTLVQDLADGTGGTVLLWGMSPTSMAAALQVDQSRNRCEPEPEKVHRTHPVVPGERVSLLGQNLWPGSLIYVGEMAANAVTYSPRGEMVSFEIPAGLPTGVPIDLRVGRSGRGERTLSGAIEVEEYAEWNPEPEAQKIWLHLPLVKK